MAKKDFSKTIKNLSNVSENPQLSEKQDIQNIQNISYIQNIQNIEKPQQKIDKRRLRKKIGFVMYSFRIEENDKTELEKIAYEQRKTVTAVINEAIKEYIDHAKKE